MKIKRIIALFATSAMLLSCASCGLVSVHRIDAPPREERVVEYDKINVNAETNQNVFSSGKSSEKRKNAAVSLIKEKCADTYSGDIVFVAETDDGNVFSDETETVRDKLTVTRNALIEETLDVKLVFHRMSENEMFGNAQREKKAGEVYDDIFVIPSDKLLKYSTKGLLYDLSMLGGFSSDEVYFDKHSTTGSSLDSAIYAVAGDASFLPEDYTVVYYDRDLLLSAGIERDAILSDVESGEWTWERMLEYDAMLDGKTIATPYSAPQFADIVYKSAGNDYLRKDKDKFSPAFDSETVRNFGELFGRIADSGVKTSSYSAADEFISGETSFLIHKLSAIEKIASSSADYGIAPLPGCDGGGECRTVMPKNIPVFAIGVNSDGKQAAYEVITAVNAATAPIIYEGYTEYILINFLREQDSAEMLGKVFASGTYDPSYILGAEYPAVASATYDFVYKYRTADEKTLDKQYKAAVTAMNKALDKAAKAKK